MEPPIDLIWVIALFGGWFFVMGAMMLFFWFLKRKSNGH